MYIQGGPKMAQNFYMPITPSNINRFSKFFHWWNQQKIVVTITLKIPPHLMGVVTLPCEMSDIALSPATTMANCMINVDWAWYVAFKQPELKSCRLCCLRGFSMLTIHDNSGALSGANCRSVWLIALLVSGVIILSASSSSKADKLNIWCENCEILQLLWTITEAINRLFCCKFF